MALSPSARTASGLCVALRGSTRKWEKHDSQNRCTVPEIWQGGGGPLGGPAPILGSYLLPTKLVLSRGQTDGQSRLIDRFVMTFKMYIMCSRPRDLTNQTGTLPVLKKLLIPTHRSGMFLWCFSGRETILSETLSM